MSQQWEYAGRATLELAGRRGNGPVPASEIARAQAIPLRFLELILAELKKAGFVESRRGAKGGYMLRQAPSALTVGEVMRFVDGSNAPVKCIDLGGEMNCPLRGRCAFQGMVVRARDAVADIDDTTTVAALTDKLPADPGAGEIENISGNDFIRRVFNMVGDRVVYPVAVWGE